MANFNFSLVYFLLLLVAVAEIFPGAESGTYSGDVEGLKEFRSSVDPNSVNPGSCLSSWDFTFDPCDSLFSERFTCGFRCDVVDSDGASRVTELSLDQAGYWGSLASLSWNLPYLQNLDISGNFFYGSVPSSLANLTRLSRLGLSGNSFSGEIPTSIGSLSSLEELYLDHNNLDGSVPSSFNGLISLKRLELQSNKLAGEFPELGSLKNLYFLDASDNNISGQVPRTLPTPLVQISMRNNSLEGKIPESINLLTSLQVLELSHNRLRGSVSATLFNHPSLQQLTLSFNQFTSIDSPYATPGTQSQLIAVDLSNNDLRGLLPAFLALMPKLSALSLENNKFTGMIPTQYALKAVVPGSGVAPLERLLLGGNYLFGPIPSPLMVMKPGSANVRLVDNCLYRCPASFFFCQGGDQKSLMECKRFSPMIP
ncbi:MDIS1-interacting receptor like kinase 1 [Carica papaya]|uniref:MDIS1-interacting receptor like kinase 1 n=1 Tax=Carica papaya TaxID=3649 RepID=UPI000B8CCFFF|nr:MDIS1-interacting receptor like kinase 1 [Carica papaya]